MFLPKNRQEQGNGCSMHPTTRAAHPTDSILPTDDGTCSSGTSPSPTQAPTARLSVEPYAPQSAIPRHRDISRADLQGTQESHLSRPLAASPMPPPKPALLTPVSHAPKHKIITSKIVVPPLARNIPHFGGIVKRGFSVGGCVLGCYAVFTGARCVSVLVR